MDVERLQEALRDFEKRQGKEVCPVLDQFLCHVRSQFKGYFIFKLEKVMDDFRISTPEPRGPPNPNVRYIAFDKMKERILKIVAGFNGIPFTVQRLCELLTDPRRNYTGTDKFLRGVEKNVMVISCVYPSSEKNNSNSLNRMNGVMFPGNSPSYTERSNINGPGTPRPLNRSKISLSAPMTRNGLPESTDSKRHICSKMRRKITMNMLWKLRDSGLTKKMKSEKQPVKRLPAKFLQMKKRMKRKKKKNQEKESDDALTVNEETSEENNQMEESDVSQAEKDLLHSEGSENEGLESSGSSDCCETKELVGSNPSKTGEILSESSMENDDEATEVTDEPMEQDYLETFRCSILHTVLLLTLYNTFM
uniref:Protein phosphatase 4 regulatory subunit 2 n=1 Tax=Rhinopithecus roxellana TaxID=61622 RepID=A0A2K6RXN6_RHIRO